LQKSAIYTKFSIQVLCFFILFYAIFLTCNYFFYKNLQDCFWLNNIFKVKQAYADSISCPKIVLVGGSNVHFSLDASYLENQLKIPVLNAGSHAGLGLVYILKNAQNNYIKRGDTVLLSIEYELFKNLDYKSQVYNQYVINYDKKYLKALSPLEKSKTIAYGLTGISLKDLIKSLQQQAAYKKKGAEALDYYIYNAENVDKNGDQLKNDGHKSLKSKYKENIENILSEKFDPNTDSVKALGQFLDWCRDNNVKVFFAFPSNPSTKILSGNSLKPFQLGIKDYFSSKNIKILDTSDMYFLDENMFYDTVYHLNSEGRKLKTNKILSTLKKES